MKCGAPNLPFPFSKEGLESWSETSPFEKEGYKSQPSLVIP
jgi:hypothetical protein